MSSLVLSERETLSKLKGYDHTENEKFVIESKNKRLCAYTQNNFALGLRKASVEKKYVISIKMMRIIGTFVYIEH